MSLFIENTYLPTLLAPFSTILPPLPPKKKSRFGFFVKIHLLENSKLEFVLKKLWTFFEMLIVPHALHCIDGCFVVSYLIWQSGILFWFSTPPPPHRKKKKKKKNEKKKKKIIIMIIIMYFFLIWQSGILFWFQHSPLAKKNNNLILFKLKN